MIGVLSQALRMPPGERNAALGQFGSSPFFVSLDGGAAQDLADPEEADGLFAESHGDRRLRQTEGAGLGARADAGVLDNLGV